MKIQKKCKLKTWVFSDFSMFFSFKCCSAFPRWTQQLRGGAFECIRSWWDHPTNKLLEGVGHHFMQAKLLHFAFSPFFHCNVDVIITMQNNDFVCKSKQIIVSKFWWDQIPWNFGETNSRIMSHLLGLSDSHMFWFHSICYVNVGWGGVGWGGWELCLLSSSSATTFRWQITWVRDPTKYIVGDEILLE